MTDQLIILNRCNNYSGEGFFKFEDGYSKMTVAFKETHKKKYYWYSDSFFGAFKEKTIEILSSPINFKPNNCGIFYEENRICYPILYFGDLDILCREFENVSKIKVLPVFIEENFKKAEKNISENENETANSIKSENIIDVSKTAEALQNSNFSQVIESEHRKEEISEKNTAKENNSLLENIPESFWEVNEKEIEKLLNTLPEDENMTSLIPGSKWVKAEDYLLGVIYDEFSMPLYLCYGFDLPWSEHPPKKLNGYSQWIPKDCSRPQEKGYWVIYVNAKTGERVK